MRSPLPGGLIVTTPYGVKGNVWRFGRHMGVDLRAGVGTPVFAPSSGVVNEAYIGSKGIKVLSLVTGDKTQRFLHLSEFKVKLKQSVKEGQSIGLSGSSGGVKEHLHWDIRKANTPWDQSFKDYYDPITLLKAARQPKGDTKEMLAQKEIAKRDSVLRSQSATIDSLQRKIKDLEVINIERTAEINRLNAELNKIKQEAMVEPASHNLVVPTPVTPPQPKVKKPPILVRVLAALLRKEAHK